MFTFEKPEVLVVGAGPVGLFTALTLRRRGVRVQVIDKEWRTGAHSYALALHPASLALLAEAGLHGPVLERAYPVRTVALYEGGTRRAALDLSVLGGTFPFVAVVRQSVLEGLLEEALAAEGVKVRWDHELAELVPEADAVTARVDELEMESLGYIVAHAEQVIARTKTLHLPFVVGADGYDSDVRRALDIAFEPVGRPQHFAVFEFKTDVDLAHTLSLSLGPRTTDVLWPLPGGYCRFSFELEEYEASEATRVKDRFIIDEDTAGEAALSDARLRALLAERAPWFTGSVEEVVWRHVVRFDRRLARSFGAGRVWLAGDAGHMTGPAGVQSMNVGLREAAELSGLLAGVLREGVPAARLQGYGEARLAEWRWLLGLDGGLVPEAEAPAWVRQHHDRLLACLPATGADLEALARLLGLAPAGAGLPA